MYLNYVDAGSYTTQLCNTLNKVRKRSSAYKMSKQCKKRRHLKKKKQDKNIQNEGTSFAIEKIKNKITLYYYYIIIIQ